MRRFVLLIGSLALGCLWSEAAFAQSNDKLQIHHMDVGQGDGAVLITPGGQVVLFDVGEDLKKKNCTKPLSYLDQLGVKKIDALFVSHYHYDHIGCIPAVLAQFPLAGNAYDRGGTYNSAQYTSYVGAVKVHRKTAKIGDQIVLDKNADQPVTISVIAVDGQSESGDVSTSNENDLSLAVVVSYGQFREEIGGDLSGDNTNAYQDVETPVAPEVGHVDVYKVHHHCSSHSTNETWLKDTTPIVGIISTGDGNAYHHPAADCLQRLRTHGLKKVYWTEIGNGGSPKTGFDVVQGNILVEVPLGGATFTVAGDQYQSAAPAVTGDVPAVTVASTDTSDKYAWSSKSSAYHYPNCAFVANISKSNLQTGDTAPAGKHLHKNCPTGSR